MLEPCPEGGFMGNGHAQWAVTVESVEGRDGGVVEGGVH